MLKKIKIAQVVCTYPPYRGGMGSVAFEYTQRLRDRGHNVHVFTTQQGATDNDPKFVHRVHSLFNVGNAGVMPSLYKRLSGFELIHLHYPFYGGAEPVVIRKAIRADQGLVMTYHMDASASGLKGAMFNIHRRLLLPWLAGRVDRILCSSQDYVDTSAIAQIENAMNRVEIHPFGVDLERFYPGDATQLRKKFGIPTTVPVLLFVGGLDRAHHFKGVPVLIEALSGIIDTSWRLIIVGDGEMKDRFEILVNKNGLKERVTFAGDVSEEELPEYYRLSDIHVFPSTRGAEAFGLVALEAAASGVPSIATDLPGVRTVVIDGSTGLLVNPDDAEKLRDAISLLLAQKELRERFGHSARMYAESNFAWEPFITALEHTYASVLEQQSARDYQL